MATGKVRVPNTRAVQLNIEGLIKLLGGTADDRLRFWEIFKGITTPAEFELVNQQLEVMGNLAKQVQTSVKALQKTAAKMR
jgi:hypothetical protein